MKKLSAFLLLLFIAISIWAQEVKTWNLRDSAPSDETDAFPVKTWGDISEVKTWNLIDAEADEEQEEEQIAGEKPQAPEKKKFRLKNRTVELRVANFGFYFANSFISAADIVKGPFELLFNIQDIIADPGLIYLDKVSIDFDEFFKGFKFGFGLEVEPLSLNFNWKDKWGFGLDIGTVKTTGNLFLSGDMLSFRNGTEKFGLGAAVFVDVGIPIFFTANFGQNVNDFKIKIKPAAYLPVAYAEPNITYNGQNGSLLKINYDMRIYTPVSLDGFDFNAALQDFQDGVFDILGNNLGYDLGLGVEYPLNDHTDIGVDIVNLPLAAATLNHYMQIAGEVSVDMDKLDIADIINGSDLPDDVYEVPDQFDPAFGTSQNGKKIYRPFAMLFYAHYRPFDSPFLTLAPSLGFSINNLYSQPGAIEGGLNVRFDLGNISITTLGVNYNDRRWKSSIDFALNLRAFEMDFGLSTQSQEFVKCFRGAGLGINFGIKMGF